MAKPFEVDDVTIALKQIKRGERIFVGTGAGAPQFLLNELVAYFKHFSDNEIVHMTTLGEAPYLDPSLHHHFHLNAFFASANTRDAINSGLAEYTPAMLSEIPFLFESGRLPIGVALIQVAPGKEPGTYNLGPSVDITVTALKSARLVIAQVNEMLPRTFGDSVIPGELIDFSISKNEPIPELWPTDRGDVAKSIAKLVENLVPDGATLQLGIGTLPHSIAKELKGKNDLGLHSELISDSVMDLMENGNLTGKKKSVNPGKALASFAMGTKNFYSFLNDNPAFEFRSTSYINDPRIIARNDNMVAINSALEIDLTGQVAADGVGGKVYSGIGGQVDFIRGAKLAKDGMAILALPSTAHHEEISRIKCELTQGSSVVTSRGDVTFVVTEYGIAELQGKSLRERALSLIEIAHPKFRAELLEQAKQKELIPKDEPRFAFDPNEFPQAWNTGTIKGGERIFIRPLKPSDEKKLQEFFYSHDEDSVYNRYGMFKKHMYHEEAVKRVSSSDWGNLALAAVLRGAFGERLCGVARYSRIDDTDTAEAAVIVGESVQSKGVGSMMLNTLTACARRADIKHFLYMIRTSNRSMYSLFKKVHENHRYEIEDEYYKCIADL